MKKLAALIAVSLLVIACQRPAGGSGSEAPANGSATPAATPVDVYDY